MFLFRPPQFPFLTLAVLLAAFGLIHFFVHFLYFLVIPQRAIERDERRDPERLGRYLERVVATPTPLVHEMKLGARLALAIFDQVRGRYAEAAAHCRTNLAVLVKHARVSRFASTEADHRLRLADCLEALGRADEADEERRLARACLDRARDDYLRSMIQGRLLAREGRQAEACRAYERALALAPAWPRAARLECVLLLSVARQSAGEPAESLRRAGEAIALGARGAIARHAHRMAGIACIELDRLDEAEQHFRRAYDVAADGGAPGERGEDLASLADILRRRGKLAEAHAAGLEAEGLSPGASRAGSGGGETSLITIEAEPLGPQPLRMAIAVRSRVLAAWGRFDEAIATLHRQADAPALAVPAFDRRSRAIFALELARVEASSGRVDDAWDHVQEAVVELGPDPKLGLQCDAVASWVLAARGLADDSRRVADLAGDRLPDPEVDPLAARDLLHSLARAAIERGDPEEGEDLLDRFLDLNPSPVALPTAHYLRGECRRLLGDTPGASADYRAALAPNIDTHHARLARGRLGEMALS